MCYDEGRMEEECEAYNGDHMSMYSVNASIPKTLVRR